MTSAELTGRAGAAALGFLLAASAAGGLGCSFRVQAEPTPSAAASGAPTVSSDPTAEPVPASSAAPSGEPTPGTNFDAIPGQMSMGPPPQTSTVSCAEANSCDVIFIPPSTETPSPFGMDVSLIDSTASQVVISVAGQRYVLEPGKPVHIQGVTVSLNGTPGAVVTLNFRKAG